MLFISFWLTDWQFQHDWENKNKANLRDLTDKMLNSGQNWRFSVPCDLEIWRMILKNNRAPLLYYFKLCAPFQSHLWMGLMQQATHPRWDYVRGRLRKQAAFTHLIENSVILDGSRRICTILLSYTHFYVLITTYSWDETFKNNKNLKKSDNEFFCGKDSQGTATVSVTGSCDFIRIPQGWTPRLKYITIVR